MPAVEAKAGEGGARADRPGRSAGGRRLRHRGRVPSLRLALPEMDSATKILLHQIQDHVAKDPAFAAGVLRGWMEEE